MAGGLAHRAWSGLRWSAAAQVLVQAAQWTAFFLLARTLPPDAYGTCATALVVGGAVAALGELGFAQALIQHPRLTPAHVSAAFWANGVAGLVLAALVALGASAVAAFFGQPDLTAVLGALALGTPIGCLGVLPRALLERELRFRALAGIEAASALGGALMVIAASLAGWGVWAMVAGQLCGVWLSATGCWAVARPRVVVGPALDAGAELAVVAIPILGTRLLGFVTSHLDAMLVGRLLGPGAMGTYSLAGKLVTWPMLRVSHLVLRVAFPALMRRREDPKAFRGAYVRLVRLLAVVVLPLLMGLYVAAPLVVPALLGPRWGEVTGLLQVLCGVGALKALVCTVGTAFVGRGRADLEFKLNVVGLVKVPLLVWFGARWGLPGVAWALLASACLGAAVQQHLANRLLGLSWRAYAAALVAPVAAALALGGAAAAWLYLGPAGPLTWRLLAAAVLGVAAHGIVLTALGFRSAEVPGLAPPSRAVA